MVIFIDILPEIQDPIAGPAPGAPSSMCPGAHDQVVVVVRGLLFYGFIGAQGAEHIFRVEPAAYDKHRRPDILQVRPDISCLPVSVIGGMSQVLIPYLSLVVKIFGIVGVLDRPEVQEELVGVPYVGIEDIVTIVLYRSGPLDIKEVVEV